MNSCQTYNLERIVNKPTCFKSPENPSCMNLVLNNKEYRFLKAKSVETGLSDFHKMVVSIFKTSFKKQKRKIVKYRDYKRFNKEKLYHIVLHNYTIYHISFAYLTQNGINKTKLHHR